ncbi:GMC oxidoreductase [Azospirillum griseum]|uniref:GMC family oxidoreductase n=1 Tax=Azospirillum griseum TaxID=2496639 RepID=A0A3S0JHC7_9PROT|nr:GMC family oxidoreductase [Azospirillum griseum]RTR18847.1 GMC family oxidoreductase [Azospirillum griseum]
MDSHYDIVVIGSGIGGGTLVHALKDSGASILLVERGDRLPAEAANWSVAAVFGEGRYRARDEWSDRHGRPFFPGVHYCVGGNSKLFGAAMFRLRAADFDTLEHADGLSPAWPVDYATLAPWYDRAEALYRVGGATGGDPTEPPRRAPYPLPPLEHEERIAELADRLTAQGLSPFPIPSTIDRPVTEGSGGTCQRCATCDGFPCMVGAKGDAETRAVLPALRSGSVTLVTRTRALRLDTTPDGRRLDSVLLERDGDQRRVSAGLVVVAAGAVNSAALLLRSANARHPQGLSNRSGQLGRNYMAHNNTALMAFGPRRNPTRFQKTLAINDFYFHGPGFDRPMGNLQLLGKLQAGMLTAAAPLVPAAVMRAATARSVDWWVMSEDLPDPDNRVTLDGDRIRLAWTPNNLTGHWALVRATARMMRRAGYPLTLTKRMGLATTSHQCGTVRFGDDPATSVLDPFCRSWEIENLFVVDSGFFPSSAAVNPALTIAAQALRTADHIIKTRAAAPASVGSASVARAPGAVS